MLMKFRMIYVLSGLLVASSVSFAQVENATKPLKNTGTAKPLSEIPTVAGSTNDVPAGKLQTKIAELSNDWNIPAGELTFRELPYGYDMLEPVIDKLTVEIHYDRHHRAYYNNFMKAIKDTEISKMPIASVFANMTSFSDAVRNNGGGFYNHVLYWENMSPDGGGEPSGELANAITKTFGTYADFVAKFEDAAKSRFGSGWAWLSVDFEKGELFISSTPNQDNPLMNNAARQGVPILALDVWEHAYYLGYQNKRADYIMAFWKKVNWKEVELRFKQVKISKSTTK